MDKCREKVDRYVSFDNIDCYKNACSVLDALFTLFEEKPELKNKFWDRFESKIPKAYFDKSEDEEVLYLVCSNVFYIEELFENSEYQRGIDAMRKAELECC